MLSRLSCDGPSWSTVLFTLGGWGGAEKCGRVAGSVTQQRLISEEWCLYIYSYLLTRMADYVNKNLACHLAITPHWGCLVFDVACRRTCVIMVTTHVEPFFCEDRWFSGPFSEANFKVLR